MANRDLFRSDTNLKPSEIKAAFERSRDIDAQLDKEREDKQQEIQLLVLGTSQMPLLIRTAIIIKTFISSAYLPRAITMRYSSQMGTMAQSV